MEDWLIANASSIVVALAATAAALLVAAVVLLVAWLRARRRRIDSHENKVEAELDRIDLELTLAEQTGRLRIIREQHEVAINELSTLISQVDGAKYAAANDPSAAVRSLDSIGDVARTVLADIRRISDAASDGEAAAPDEVKLDSTTELFDAMRAAGLAITVEETGEPFELKQGAELAIYRILQEALANSLSFGGEGTEVKVSYTWTDDSLQVLVDDDGIRAAARRAGEDPNAVAGRGYELDDDLSALTGVVAGVGITEMRERTEMFGGIFKAYPVPGVGFSVSAIFPALKYHNGIHGVNLESSAS